MKNRIGYCRASGASQEGTYVPPLLGDPMKHRINAEYYNGWRRVFNAAGVNHVGNSTASGTVRPSPIRESPLGRAWC